MGKKIATCKVNNRVAVDRVKQVNNSKEAVEKQVCVVTLDKTFILNTYYVFEVDCLLYFGVRSYLELFS